MSTVIVSSLVGTLAPSFKSGERHLPVLVAFLDKSIAAGDEARIRHACHRIQNYVADKNVLDAASRGHFMSQLLALLLGPVKLSSQLANSVLGVLTSLFERDKGETKLEVPWQRVLELFERDSFPSLFPSHMLSDADDRLTKSWQTFIHVARRYFDKSMVPQMLERCLSGLVYPNHNESEKSLSLLSLFLPDDEFLQWVEPLLGVWPLVQDHSSWDNKILTLLGRAAKSALKTYYVFSDSVVEAVFSRVLTRLDVTLGGSSKLVEGLMSRPESTFYGNVGEKAGISSSFSRWVSCSLTPRDNDPVFAALERFMSTVETYYHPSNRGKWSGSLAAVLAGLSRGLAARVSRQRNNKVHASKELRQSDCERVVGVLLKVVHYALWSKDDDLSMSARNALKNMGYVAPSLVFEPLMDKLYFALQTLTATHQTVAAISTLGVIAHPLFSRSNPSGAKHLIPLMMLAMHGIDPNDSTKTTETFKFFVSVLQWIPLVDESDNDLEPANELDAAAKQATSEFGDWCLRVWEKITVLLSHLQKQQNVSFRAQWDYQVVLSPFLRLFFAQMSPSFRLRFVKDHLVNYLVTERASSAMTEVLLIVTWAVSSDPAAILPELAPRILQLVWKKGKFLDAGVPVLTWALELLAGCAKRAGDALIPFAPQFVAVALACIDYEHGAIDSKDVKKRGGDLLSAVFSSLVNLRVQDQFYDPTAKNHFLRWGEVFKMDYLGNSHWIAPTKPAIACAADLMKQVLSQADQLLSSNLEDDQMSKLHLRLVSVLRAGNALPFCDDEKDLSEERNAADLARGLVPYFVLKHEFGCEVEELGFVRKSVRDLIFRLHTECLAKRGHSSEPFSLLCSLIDLYQMGDSSDTGAMIMSQARKQWKFKLRSSLLKGSSRFMNIWKSEAFFRQLLPLRSQDAPDTENSRRLVSILVDLAVSEYATVRKTAQEALLITCVTSYHQTREVVIPRMVEKFLAAETEQQVKGCLHFFDEPLSLDKARRYRSREFLRALLKCSRFDHAKIQIRVLEVFQSFLGLSLAAVHLSVLPTANPDFHAARNRRLLEVNRGVIEDLLAVGSSRPHWRYEVMVCAMLTVLSRADDPNVKAVRFLAERLVSDVPQLRGIASTAVTLFLKRHSHKVSTLRHEWRNGPVEGEFLDKPWQGFSPHRFLVKVKNEELTRHECVTAVLEFLEKPGIAERVATLSALDSASSAHLESRSSAIPSHMSSMLRAYGIDTSIVGGGGNESSEKKIVLDNLEQMWPLTPVSVTLGMFRISRAMLWKSIVKSCNREIPEFLYATISSFIQPTRTREENAVAMEMVAGALRATKSAPARMIEILKPALLGCSNDAHYDFLPMLRFSVYNRDPRRFKPLIECLFSLCQQNETASSTLAKSLRYAETMIVEFDWKIADECRNLYGVLKGLLGYPYVQVRLAAAGVLFRILSLAKGAPNFEELLSCVDGEEDIAAKSRKRESVLMLLSMAVRSQNKQLTLYFGKVLEFVFAAHLDVDKDVSKLAKNLTSTQALTLFTAPVLEREIRPTLNALANSTSWKQRAAIPLVLTLLDFNHRFVARPGSFLQLALTLLKDPHVEVRQVAELALRSMLTGSLNEQTALWLEKECDAMIAQKLVHSAALCYSAIILSCAYTVPPFVVPSIRKLIGMAGIAPPVGSTVQSTIAEFRRTHRDAAEEEEDSLLDPELMRAVKNAIVKPSYFA